MSCKHQLGCLAGSRANSQTQSFPSANDPEADGPRSSLGSLRTCGLLLTALVLWTPGFSQVSDLPELGPQVTGAIPLGARQDEAVDVRLRGRNLDGITGFAFAHPRIQATVLSSSFYQARVRILVGGRVSVGPAATVYGLA